MSTAVEPIAGVFEADPAHSSFQFAIRHMKVSAFRASFGDVQARLVSDDEGVRLEGVAEVESISITRPLEFREHVLNGADFFDAGHHPQITFRSDHVQLANDGTATVRGELTIKGIAKEITASGTHQPPVEDPYGAACTALELKATVDRRDWGMTWQAPLPKGGDVLGYEVDLTVHLEFVKQG